MTLPLRPGLLLLIALSSTGCAGTITKAMWYEPETTPPIVLVSTPCEAEDVTVPVDPENAADTIGVRFSVRPTGSVPPHMLRYTAAKPGFLALTPSPEHGGDWRKLPGADLFAPSFWELRVTGGSYFRQPGSNARLVFHGTLAPADVGQLLKDSQLRPELRNLATDLRTSSLPHGWAARRLEGFALHRWAELLAPEPNQVSYRATPVAWLDRDMRVVQDPSVPLFAQGEEVAAIRARLDALSLLGRLDGEYGEVLWVIIPAAVLVQGPDLHLRRDHDVVRWSRQQIWRGRLRQTPPAPATRLPYPIPLRGGLFEYRYATEVQDSKFVFNALKVIATPITALLDFAIATNPYLKNLLDLFRDKPLEAEEKNKEK